MMRSRRFPAAHSSGFTLLELLVSLALLGVILVLLFGGLRLGIRSWDAVQRGVDNLNSVRSLEGLLRRELEQIQPYQWKDPGKSTIAFSGSQNRLQFVAPLAARIGAGGLFAISLELENFHDQRRIQWRYVPIGAGTKDFSELDRAPPMVLAASELNGVQDITLSFFGAERDGEPAQWWDRWEARTSLPALIRIRIRFTDGTEWPEFVVAPMLAGRLQP